MIVELYLRNSYAESVAAHIIGADGQVADLEALHSVYIQALINYASMWGDGAAFSWGHTACSERVPCCFDVTLNCEMVRREIQ